MICIIGAGAAGLAASILMARKLPGRRIVLIERLDRVGKKLLATGNGRCNLANIQPPKEHYFGDTQLALPILEQFDAKATMEFFEGLGVCCVAAEEGKLYPRSMQASAVLDCLRNECARLGIEERCSTAIAKIQQEKHDYALTTRSGDMFRASAVVIACGGKAQSALGSDGSGYLLLKALGHTITPLYPALVQLKTQMDDIRSLEGIKVDANVTALCDGKIVREEFGEVLFTNYGVSGPPIFQLSTALSLALSKNPRANCIVSLDLLKEYFKGELFDMLAKRAQTLGHLSLDHFFVGLLHRRLGLAVLKSANVIPLARKCSTLNTKELTALVKQLKGFEVNVLEALPFANAQVTGGGAMLQEFDSSLQSIKLPGLFACGEVLNVNGDCGGYNLQWAWSSAFACANGVAEYLRQSE